MIEDNNTNSPLGIVAGNGALPLYIAKRTYETGRPVFIVGIEGTTSKDIEQYPHCWLKWGQIDKLFDKLKKAHVKELVIIGGVKRPAVKNIHFDFGLIRNLPFVLSLFMGGDDSILSSIVQFIEEKGLQVVGAHQIAPELTADTGILTKKSPSKKDDLDIKKGITTVLNLGTMDIGQGAVVARNYVLCVEAAEGTDQMLKRAAGLRQWGSKWLGRRIGVLVKLPKPNQELRIDMPTIGPKTVELVASAGLAGICIAADKVLISDKQETISRANKLGLFIIGKEINSKNYIINDAEQIKGSE